MSAVLHKDQGGPVGTNGECLVCTAEAGVRCIIVDPRDPDPSREGMWRYHNCSYCDDGRKPCKQGGAHRCSNPHARND